jgi:organic hydroperoxide reductase OsmC/OhrA
MPSDPQYTATVRTTDGHVRADDGALDLAVAAPTELGGQGGATNAEQLLAAALGACFRQALAIAASSAGVDASGAEVSVSVEVAPEPEGPGWRSTARLSVRGLPGGDGVVGSAVAMCPFTKVFEAAGQLEVAQA